MTGDRSASEAILPTELMLGTSCGCSECARLDERAIEDIHDAQSTLLKGVGITSAMCETVNL